jgi:uncharacterized protein with PIN domain
VTTGLYLDVHIPRAVTVQLRLAGVDVLTAQEDGFAEVGDTVLMDRATVLGRVLISQDKDLLAEASRRQQTGVPFGGLVHSRPLDISIGTLVRDLRLIAGATDSSDWQDRVEFLPL